MPTIRTITDNVYRLYTIGRAKLAGVFKEEVWYIGMGVVGGVAPASALPVINYSAPAHRCAAQ